MNRWRIIALIFIILFILESALFITLYKIGSDSIQQKESCRNRCVSLSADSFVFNEASEMCTCYSDSGGEMWSGKS